MEAQPQQGASEFTSAINAAYPKLEPRRVILTVRQFSERNPAFTEASLRNYIFKANHRESSRGQISGNGLIQAGALIRIGRKVLIDEAAFFAWMDAQQGA